MNIPWELPMRNSVCLPWGNLDAPAVTRPANLSGDIHIYPPHSEGVTWMNLHETVYVKIVPI